MRAKTLRAAAYKQAMMQAESLRAAYKIQESAMIEARREASDVNRKAEQADRVKNSERWSSIWYEAY